MEKDELKQSLPISKLVLGWISRPVMVALLGVSVGLLGGLFLGREKVSTLNSLPELGSMEKCRDGTLKILDLKQPPSISSLKEILGHCYAEIMSQGLLNDFELRKGTYRQQYLANGVLLWMVVSITISGVILAGVQLAASYKLAQANKVGALATNDEVSLKRDKIVLKSSVTGLFILLISFAFFLVFVLYVYKIEPEGGATKPQTSATTLPEGGLGPPPVSSK